MATPPLNQSTPSYIPRGGIYDPATGKMGQGPLLQAKAINLPKGMMDTGEGYTTDTQANELVSTNLNSLIDENGQYIQQARQGAINQANSRGLLNSSVAAGNAQGAAIQAALPIAVGDANAYHTTAIDNADNMNRVKMADISAEAQVAAAGAGAAAQIAAAQINNMGALQRQQENLAFTGEQSALNRDFVNDQTQQQYLNQLGLAQETAGLGLSNYLAEGQFNLYSNLTQDQFGLATNLITGSQNFGYNAALQAMQNPGLMGDPTALGGFIDFMQGPANNMINNLLANLFGSYGAGGSP